MLLHCVRVYQRRPAGVGCLRWEFDLARDSASFFGREGIVERSRHVRVQVVEHIANEFGVGVGLHDISCICRGVRADRLQ
jgi:hypothetical protein